MGCGLVLILTKCEMERSRSTLYQLVVLINDMYLFTFRITHCNIKLKKS